MRSLVHTGISPYAELYVFTGPNWGVEVGRTNIRRPAITGRVNPPSVSRLGSPQAVLLGRAAF
jgi:hypothetical protein